MSSAHHKAENLIAIVDRNHIQNDGFSDYQRFPDGNGSRPQRPGGWVLKDGHTANIMNLEPFEDKWKAFGWNTQHIDGHDFDAIINALEKPRRRTPASRRSSSARRRRAKASATWRTTRTSTAKRHRRSSWSRR